MLFLSTLDNHKKQIQRTHQMRHKSDLQSFFSSVPVCQHSYMVFQDDYLRGTAEKCASQWLALHNIHPITAARKYFHYDVIAFKSEQQYRSSNRTEHSLQRLFISEKTTNSKDKIHCRYPQKCFWLCPCTLPRPQKPVTTTAAGRGCIVLVFSLLEPCDLLQKAFSLFNSISYFYN